MTVEQFAPDNGTKTSSVVIVPAVEDMTAALQALDVICNELNSLNKNIERYLKAIAPEEEGEGEPPMEEMVCWQCLDPLDTSLMIHYCRHGRSCIGCGSCMECDPGFDVAQS